MANPVLIRARRADISPLVVAVGDPDRTKQLAKMLREAKIVNSNRGLLTYTGYYNHKRVTIATHGIGGPSSAIVFEELLMLGVRSIIRLGTCGALVRELNPRDFIIPTAAAHSNGSLRPYETEDVLPPVPDFFLTAKLIEECKLERARFKVGLVFSSDAFYNEDRNFAQKWSHRNVLGVDMECATLFTIGILRKFKTASLLVVSDSLIRRSREIETADKLEAQMRQAGRAVLNTLTSGPV